jgi:hypothetical protein
MRVIPPGEHFAFCSSAYVREFSRGHIQSVVPSAALLDCSHSNCHSSDPRMVELLERAFTLNGTSLTNQQAATGTS